MPHVVVMVTTSYPRFPGDSVGTFMEPIAQSVAARGHEVHIVAPWHPLVSRAGEEKGIRFHFYRYAPVKSLNVFGYAAAMRAARRRALGVGEGVPLCVAAGRLVRKKGFEYLIDALALAPGIVLAIAGDGTLAGELQARARTAGVADRIRFLGNQPQDRVG